MVKTFKRAYIALLTLFKGTVGIHDGHCGNKVDGLFELNELSKSTSRTSGRGLKEQTGQQTRQAAKQNK